MVEFRRRPREEPSESASALRSARAFLSNINIVLLVLLFVLLLLVVVVLVVVVV